MSNSIAHPPDSQAAPAPPEAPPSPVVPTTADLEYARSVHEGRCKDAYLRGHVSYAQMLRMIERFGVDREHPRRRRRAAK